ncbi:MAG: glycosyltransferase family 2 protein [Patescibacteria group bacterium]
MSLNLRANSSKDMLNPLVTIIIVNWNGRVLLEDCLSSLLKISYKNKEIIFVDNASTDNSLEYAKKMYPGMKIIQNSKNLGYAEGHEEAIRKAKGELILLLSTDTIVKENMLSAMVVAIYKEKNIGAVMPKLLMYPNTNLIDSIGTFFVRSGVSYHFGREKDSKLPIYNKSMEIYSAKGACLLFKKNVLEKTGLFDKDYFAYFEETDLCHRIWLAGYKIIYTPDTEVYHKGAGTSKKIARAYIQFHSFKNRLLTYLKNLSTVNIITVLPLTLLVYQAIFLLFLLTGKFRIAFAVQGAIIWNLLNIKKTLEKRRYIQEKIRKISDSEFLPKITRSVRPSYYYYMFKGLGLYND